MMAEKALYTNKLQYKLKEQDVKTVEGFTKVPELLAKYGFQS